MKDLLVHARVIQSNSLSALKDRDFDLPTIHTSRVHAKASPLRLDFLVVVLPVPLRHFGAFRASLRAAGLYQETVATPSPTVSTKQGVKFTEGQ